MVLPFNEFDRDSSLKNRCAKCCWILFKRLVTTSVTQKHSPASVTRPNVLLVTDMTEWLCSLNIIINVRGCRAAFISPHEGTTVLNIYNTTIVWQNGFVYYTQLFIIHDNRDAFHSSFFPPTHQSWECQFLKLKHKVLHYLFYSWTKVL